jgi:Fe-S-cluster containining protein
MISYLSSILTQNDCAQCKFCCLFERPAAWETPLFSKKQTSLLKKKYGDFAVKPVGNSFTLNMEPLYKTDSNDEFAPCPFLDQKKGCILKDTEKPFDCKIWPLRIMRQNKDIVIVLTPTCTAINNQPIEKIKKLVVQDGLGEVLFKEAQKTPDIIKDYRKDFPILMRKEYTQC